MVDLLDWRGRMLEDMKLHDFRPKTQEAYALAARQLVDHFEREPETLTEDDVRAYFLYLREGKQLAPSTIKIAICAVRFLFVHTLQRDWALFELLRVKMPRTLPLVLSIPEVRAVLAAIRLPVRRVALTTIYALGLRLGEALSLEKTDILGDRLLVSIRDGKGAKDRTVPLPRPLLARLRHYWKHERPTSATPYLFVVQNGAGPYEESTLQKTFTAARTEIGLAKHATIHTLRHCYATHLLESGISLRTVQMLLGHKSLRTTELYLHVTQPSTERLQETLDRLMADLF